MHHSIESIANRFDYSFPFLDRGCPGLVTSADRRVDPLFLQLFHAHCPSLSFVGIPHSVVPFPLFEYQALLLAAVASLLHPPRPRARAMCS